jgi:hypothetical protein
LAPGSRWLIAPRPRPRCRVWPRDPRLEALSKRLSRCPFVIPSLKRFPQPEPTTPAAVCCSPGNSLVLHAETETLACRQPHSSGATHRARVDCAWGESLFRRPCRLIIAGETIYDTRKGGTARPRRPRHFPNPGERRRSEDRAACTWSRVAGEAKLVVPRFPSLPPKPEEERGMPGQPERFGGTKGRCEFRRQDAGIAMVGRQRGQLTQIGPQSGRMLRQDEGEKAPERVRAPRCRVADARVGSEP